MDISISWNAINTYFCMNASDRSRPCNTIKKICRARTIRMESRTPIRTSSRLSECPRIAIDLNLLLIIPLHEMNINIYIVYSRRSVID